MNPHDTLKPKKCKADGCITKFTPRTPMQCVCGPACAQLFARAKKEQAETKARQVARKADRAKRESLKTRSDWMREAQSEVNRYVRLRDHSDGCISCDKPAGWLGQWHASHFRSVGAASAVRFNTWNIHKSCSICNNHKSGNIHDYTPRIILKIGVDKYEFLKSQNNIYSYSIEYLKRVKYVFRKKANRLEKRIFC